MSAVFASWLAQNAGASGAVRAACLRLDDPELQQLLRQRGEQARRWLEEGRGGEMAYLERQLEDKIDLQRAFPGMRSAIVITFTNDWGVAGVEHPFPVPAPGAPLGYISAYARGLDYHRRGHAILAALAARLRDEYGGGEFVPAVDTRPVMERELAVYGGLGVMGPNDLLRTAEHEVRVFIGTLFTSLELPQLRHEPPRMRFPCHHCRRCEQSCPTGAITPGAAFDARLCIAYLNIEKKGVLHRAERQLMGDWLFGCDHCTEVCPPKDKDPKRIPLDLGWLLQSSAGEIERLIKPTSLAYAGVPKLRRNAVAILQGSDHPQAAALLAWAREHVQARVVQEQLQLQD